MLTKGVDADVAFLMTPFSSAPCMPFLLTRLSHSVRRWRTPRPSHREVFLRSGEDRDALTGANASLKKDKDLILKAMEKFSNFDLMSKNSCLFDQARPLLEEVRRLGEDPCR